ncbi:mutator type transposase, partial [Tanacetum coccineum]
GIVPAISTLFPSVEHKFCLKHIYDKLVWMGQLYKECLWKCVTSTTIQYFDKNMDELKDTCKDAYEWLKKIPPVNWSRSHFSNGRDKPIITCLEYIREYLMKKIVDVQKVIAKCDGPLTQNVTKLFNVIKEKAAQYKVEWNGDDKYQVIRPKGYQCVVNMSTKVCTCRRWELTRIPCKHAVAAINDIENNDMVIGNKKRKIAAQGKSSSQPPPVSSPARPSQGIILTVTGAKKALKRHLNEKRRRPAKQNGGLDVSQGVDWHIREFHTGSLCFSVKLVCPTTLCYPYAF